MHTLYLIPKNHVLNSCHKIRKICIKTNCLSFQKNHFPRSIIIQVFVHQATCMVTPAPAPIILRSHWSRDPTLSSHWSKNQTLNAHWRNDRLNQDLIGPKNSQPGSRGPPSFQVSHTLIQCSLKTLGASFLLASS